MNGNLFSSSLTLFECTSCVLALVFVYKRDKGSEYRALQLLLKVKTLFYLILVPLALFGGYVLEKRFAYRLYFDLYWIDFALEAALSLVVVWSLFNVAMSPLAGMKDLGDIVFRWAAAISITTTIAVLCIPSAGGLAYVTHVLTLLQLAKGVLTLSLLLFVCFALRPLGLSPRSRPFGVVVCLSVLAAITLVSAAWLAYSKDMYSDVDNVKSIATSLALLLCAVYFILPEPKRQMIILPTTSPYLRWNRVAEVLGDPPGFVAIAGVPPEMFAPAEIEVMKRASKMMVPPVFPLTYLIEEPQSEIA